MLRRPFFLSAVAVTALLVLAASVAGTRPLRAGGVRNGSLPASFFTYTITTLVIVGGIALICIAPLLRGGLGERKPRSFVERVLVTVGILAVIVGLLALIFRYVHFSTHRAHGHASGATFASSARAVSLHWVWLLGGGGLAGLLVLLVWAGKQRANGAPGGSRVERLAAAIGESLDDLRADGDLRRAIVAAYARMETVLADTGVPRHPAEAPQEYLERALRSVDTSAMAARRLTDLFERARFSHHEPDSRMRDDAIEALAAVRDELRATGA